MPAFRNVIKLTLVVMLSAVALGCARIAPLYNPPEIAVPQGMTQKQVGDAVLSALPRRGWVVDKAQPGLITASVSPRGHTATVQIQYDQHAVRVSYKSSENLDYSMKNGQPMIHKNYNSWVQNLVGDIRTELSRYYINK